MAGNGVDREALSAALDTLDAAFETVAQFDCQALTTPEHLRLLERVERWRRRLPALEHPVINALRRQATPAELGGKLERRDRRGHPDRQPRGRPAHRRGRRSGPAPRPDRPTDAGAAGASAAAQRQGTLGPGQVAVIRKFFKELPGWIDTATREQVEALLAAQGTQFRPEQLAALAATLAECLNPDGTYTDEDRARARALVLGNQQADGMSELRAMITPELRATIEAVMAKLAAPGMCNPEDDTACVDGAPTQEAIDNDSRSQAQRQHDAINTALRALLMSGKLGQHNGLPTSIVVTTTLAELEAAAGKGLTGGGTILPMSDVIRQARHARHYLAIFDQGKALALYHTKRVASPAQRLVLYAKDRGCSAPGCTVPGYYCEVHHVIGYAVCRATDINNLTLGCGTQHRIIQPGGWSTRKNTHGDTEWIPPPHLDRGQPRTNTYWHPEKLLHPDDDDEGESPGAA
ncbi:HNH endonuclease signature motif containing protein [Mycobacterium interjectum]|uniref:HNH endonuclease signature motif containing protein n=1 Tax=Mycobacterium interjectum TaxID=33895 RepID=UPI0021F2C3E5|nr:HNH endonuclease signature motif containing protein [Mycobacterium interjectum]MCV7093360.1 HNH endonuclease [Mycobacterium interjectum]